MCSGTKPWQMFRRVKAVVSVGALLSVSEQVLVTAWRLVIRELVEDWRGEQVVEWKRESFRGVDKKGGWKGETLGRREKEGTERSWDAIDESSSGERKKKDNEIELWDQLFRRGLVCWYVMV